LEVDDFDPYTLPAGLYACQQDGVRLFASDVLYACDLFVAASHNKKSRYAQSLAVRPYIASHNRPGLAAALLRKA